MEPALDVLNRALLGDRGARSFLERTSSIYVLDVTEPSKPKTYGCWNFIHQAMNEVERFEAKAAYGIRNNNGDHRHAGIATANINDTGLVHHVRLLSMMALRVARRAPATDKALIMTCISNAAQFDGSNSGQSQWLIDLNLELREIVMGRIAAMAFDFSFHRQVGAETRSSAFADMVVIETFSAILSANAVASGPSAIRHFATEWIIPSSRNLPPCALASVVLHIALEGVRKTSPAGTVDMLQQLSLQVISMVVVPILADAIMENSSTLDQAKAPHEASAHISSVCLRAISAWCTATELSLPQIRHICNKININFVDVINDAMYSDSPKVIEALAELIETLVLETAEKPASTERMNQVRHLLQVDEETFLSRFSSDQLKTIELKEMESIVEELVSSIGLQRFRFTERQRSGDNDVCRNLARIAASICLRCLMERDAGFQVKPDPGMIELLYKAASHPSVNISAVALNALCEAAKRGYAGVDALLPILQRRAIIPHHATSTGHLSLSAHDLCGVTYQDFEIFRESVLTQALMICWNANGVEYMESCTAAVEEFCTDRPSAELTMQLEAALFCIEVMAGEMHLSPRPDIHFEQFKRCSAALGTKPQVLIINPLTLSRMCRLLGKLARQLTDESGLSFAADMAATSFHHGIRMSSDSTAQDVIRESDVSLTASASQALKHLCFAAPKFFATEMYLKALADVWEASCTASPDSIESSDRLALWSGICNVLATMDDASKLNAFELLASSLLDALNVSVVDAKNNQDPMNSDLLLSPVAENLTVLAALPRTFVCAGSTSNDMMQSGCDTSPDTHAVIPESVMSIIRRGWPSIMYAAENFSHNEDIASSLCGLLSKFLPPAPNVESHHLLLKDLCAVADTMIRHGRGHLHTDFLFEFLSDFVTTNGECIEEGAVATVRGAIVSEDARMLGCIFEEILLGIVGAVRMKLGSAWTTPKEQGQGQPPFESKPVPVQKLESVSNESLAGILSLAKTCMVSCPLFFFHFPASPRLEPEDHMFLRRAIDSAAVSLNDSDPSLASSAMRFLKAVFSLSVSLRYQTQEETKSMKPSRSEQRELEAFLSDTLARTRADVIQRLLLGCCGTMDRSLMKDTSELLTAILQGAPMGELEAEIVSALRQGYFLLGDEAKNTTLFVLKKTAERFFQSPDLVQFLEDLWDLHQVEDADALPSSNSVAMFIRKYHRP